MHTDTLEILKAKASALRALRDALAKSGVAGQPSIDFVTTWTVAVESMIPATDLDSEVTRWRDRQGDVWVPNAGGGWRTENDSDNDERKLDLDAVVNIWGPLTRADR